MNPAAVVSTECPTCGAPLDFDDAARAIRCDHCRSQLLVTGRRQVLSYEIEPRTSESEARSLVRFSFSAEQRGDYAATGTLHLVPYYRFTAEEIVWQRTDDEKQRRRNVREVAAMLGVAPPGVRSWDEAPVLEDDEPSFQSRVLERNFVARATSVVPHSLGVRPTALPLRLFDARGAEEMAIVVAPDSTPRGARERALGGDTSDAATRALLRVVLQIVYFPFWMVPVSARGRDRVAVVDAVAGRVLRDDVPPGDVAALSHGRSRRARTLGFRPLVCPNCGWDLPFRPDDVLFQCGSCERAWLARGDRLDPTSFSVGASSGDPDRHLPVWRLGGGAAGPAIYAPASRCRRAKSLFDLGARLTRRGTRLDASDRVPARLVGCALDELDARSLARFLVTVIGDEVLGGAARPPLPESIDALEASLVWLPFTSDGYALVEPTTGAPIPRRLLDVDDLAA